MSVSRRRRLGQSFWFLPAVLCLVAVVLAETLIALDRRVEDVDLGPLGILVAEVGPSGSRDLLGAIAGSMLTVASTTFSITVAVLALSSSTYGPRLVRNFMADRGNQFVLGVFVATFLYSLLVLRSIRLADDGTGQPFVPHIAANVSVLLAVLAIGVLVYFIHHISDLVQVWTLARRVRTDLAAAVDRLYPEPLGRDARDIGGARGAPEVPDGLETEGVHVAARETGYVQGVGHDELVELAARHDLVVALRIRPGRHTVTGTTLAVLWPAARVDDAVADGVRSAVLIGAGRTPDEDVQFPAQLLEEMAVRALSPSTNDPYTALNALDDLAAGLVLLAGRRTPSPYRYDAGGELRIVAPPVELTELLDAVLTAMRRYALAHPSVLHRTLELVEQVERATADAGARARMDVQVQRLLDAFERTSPQDGDLEELARHAEHVRRALGAPAPSGA